MTMGSATETCAPPAGSCGFAFFLGVLRALDFLPFRVPTLKKTREHHAAHPTRAALKRAPPTAEERREIRKSSVLQLRAAAVGLAGSIRMRFVHSSLALSLRFSLSLFSLTRSFAN